MEEKIDTFNHTEIKNLHLSKDTINNVREGEKPSHRVAKDISNAYIWQRILIDQELIKVVVQQSDCCSIQSYPSNSPFVI